MQQQNDLIYHLVS